MSGQGSGSSSFVVFSEANPEGKTISSPCNRDGYTAEISFCTLQKGLYLALQALHTHQCAGCSRTRAVRETSFTHQEIISSSAPVSLLPTAGDEGTMPRGSAQRSPCYSLPLGQRICFIFQPRRQVSTDE